AQGVDADERPKKVAWAAELLGITHLLDRRPRQLSGGERQRVALARALVREPSVFLLDEPLSNLDAKLRAAARDDLKQFQRRVGTTTVYVTHDQVEAMGMGDHIAVMSKGKLRQLGTPVDVYHHPADTFVATFLGSPPMNIVHRDDVLVGFRPEALLPKGVVEPDEGAVTVTFNVQRTEYLGAERHLIGTVTGLGEDTRVISLVPANVSVEVAEGEAHEFVVRGADLRFFDRTSQLATADRSRL
ncbi:MAG: ABC transporter ATP-binding protein, partial [Acidimicrobiales bacterium]